MKDKKTWEQTIVEIRQMPEFANLVVQAYFDADLVLNVERFRNSLEYKESLKLINSLFPNAKPKILDVGAGNGISSVALALDGFEVMSVEPDPSETVGAGAINFLKEHFKLKNLTVFQGYGEQIDAQNQTFDLVHVRQALHHANDLDNFCKEIARLLKTDGIFIAFREHTLAKEEDLEAFFNIHPLQKMYGGEYAYTLDRYKVAISQAGFKDITVIHHVDSPINYFPESKADLIHKGKVALLDEFLNFKGSRFLKPFLKKINDFIPLWSEDKIMEYLRKSHYYPGIMYSFVAKL